MQQTGQGLDAGRAPGARRDDRFGLRVDRAVAAAADVEQATEGEGRNGRSRRRRGRGRGRGEATQDAKVEDRAVNEGLPPVGSPDTPIAVVIEDETATEAAPEAAPVLEPVEAPKRRRVRRKVASAIAEELNEVAAEQQAETPAAEAEAVAPEVEVEAEQPAPVPAELDGPLFTLFGAAFPAYRGFMMVLALAVLAVLWLALTRTRIGLVIQAALSHPDMVEVLGHDLPRIHMLVFGGGAALAGLAGVIGGNAFVTEPAMAAQIGPILFVVAVVGGLGSLLGAFIASLLIGLLQTFAVAVDVSLAGLLASLGLMDGSVGISHPLLELTLARAAPILPYLLLVLMLVLRPLGLMGRRE